MLWEQHPLLQWVNDQVLAAFGRQEAPLLQLEGALEPGETIFILSGLVPNRKSHPLIQRWFGVRFYRETEGEVLEFPEVLARSNLQRRQFPNRSNSDDTAALEALLPKAVDAGREWMRRCREEFQQEIRPKLQRQLAELDRLRTRRMAELERRYGPDGQLTQLIQGQKDQKRRESEQLFQDYCDWIEDTLETGETPYLQVVAVLTGGGSELN